MIYKQRKKDKKFNPFSKPPIQRVKVPPEVIRYVVTRDVWGAEPANDNVPMEPSVLPVENVIFTYDTGSKECQDEESCHRELRKIQQNHQQRGFADIAYNFLIGGDKKIYEGRGWDFKPEINEKFPEIHHDCIEIAFIGNYVDTDGYQMSEMLTEGLHAIQLGVQAKNVQECFRLKETTLKIKIESLGEDERPWTVLKNITCVDLTDPPNEDEDLFKMQ